MDADTRLANLNRLITAYQESRSHPNAFACCSAHAVADETPALVADVVELRAQLAIRDGQVVDLSERLAEAEHSLDISTSDEQAGAPV